MRLGTFTTGRNEVDDLFNRFFGGSETMPAWTGGYSVPTDVFHMDDRLVIQMDLPGVNPDEVEVTVQENTLLINGKRSFPFDAKDVRFVRRGVFYGDFTQRVSLGKGLDVENINASYDNGVLTLTVPYSAEVQPKKISIEVGNGTKSLTS
ncbi:MAG TPA: Hsp20/alpha crystallin family protein [Actinomycetota bacterium]|nr:Hsp20/alpha crystallin family protein [Actinomycetota bacterium]